jgi:signal transduction histidine kinase
MKSKARTLTMVTTEGKSLESNTKRRSTRLIWGSFAIALLLLVVVCVGMVKKVGAGYSDIAPIILANATALRVNYIASEARMVNMFLSQIALRYASEGSKLDLKALVRQGVIDSNIFAKVQILDAHGELLLSSIEAPLGMNLSHTMAFRTHASTNNGRMLIEADAFDSVHPQDFAGFSQRLTDPNGIFAGVVLASFIPERLSQARNDAQIRFKIASHLVDFDGEILSVLLGEDRRAIHDYKNHPLPALFSQGLTQGSYESPLGDDGINRVFVYQKVPGLDLVVVSSGAARGWDGLTFSTKQLFYASAAALFLAIFVLLVSFRSHTLRLNHALAQQILLADQLKTSEERLSLAIMGGRLGTWDWSLRDKEFRTNALLNTLFKSWPQEIELNSDILHKLIHPVDSDAFIRSLKQHMRGETSDFFCECRMRDPADNWKWARVIGRITERGPDHEPLRLSGTVMDITVERTLQIKLEDRSNQLTTIFALSQDALVVFDQNQLVKFINPAFKQLTRLEPDPLLGLNEAQFVDKLNAVCAPGKQFCGFAALRKPAPITGARVQKSLILQGSVSKVLMTTLTSSKSSSVSQILSLRDVSNETLIEKLKSEFLSTAAHEIRSPMASILGFAELMTNTELGASDRSEFSHIILSQAVRIKSLLDELLDLARIDAGGAQHFDFESVDLRDLVKTVVTEFIPPDGRPAPTIELPCRYCRIDFDKAAQALLNVISNAFKYSDKGSPVNISYATPTVINHQEMAGITVQDSGIGMHQADLQKVFDRFFRANQKTSVAGTGLGMAIVKEIMTLHDGEIVVKSVYGQGTAVTLLFPISKQMKLPIAPALAAGSGFL